MDDMNIIANSDHEDDRQLKRILSTLIWISWCGSFFGIILSLYYRDVRLFAVVLAGSALLGVPFVLLKRRHLHTSGMFLMLIMIGMTTFIATVGQGIRDLAVFGYIIVIIFAGLALNSSYFKLCVGLSLVAVCWLVFGESFGWFVTTPFIGGVTNWFYLAGMTIIFLIAALAVNLLSMNIRKSLERERAEVTRREKVEEEIRQLNAELEQRVEERTRELQGAQEQLVRQEKLAVLGQLAGGVGHELRNPLSVINSAMYYLKMVQPDAPAKIQDYHAKIEQEVRNADKIITDLLDFARVKGGQQEQFPVDKLVHSTLVRFPVPVGVELTLDLAEHLPMVFIDPRQMEQVLGNLVVNACQAMATQKSSATGVKNSARLAIISDQSPVTSDQWVRISVKDTGTGITPENMQRLFEPLFTTKARGIGLGLAVSRKLTEANGGRIEAESEPGKGSTFTLWLPVNEGPL